MAFKESIFRTFAPTASELIIFLIGGTSHVFSNLALNASITDDLRTWAKSIINPHFVEALHPAFISCLNDNNSVNDSIFKDLQWVDFEGMPILGDRLEINVSEGSLYLRHAQLEDTRRVICVLDSHKIFDHYVIVYDIPRVRLEYTMVYRMPMCLEELIHQKASNVDLLIKHNPITLHHGLIYKVGKTSCYYSDSYATAFATITIYCEDRIRDLKKSCNTLECYYSQTRGKLLNASIDSARRWREIESDPQKYYEILKNYVRMPEFRLESMSLKPDFVNLCQDKYILWKDILCLPCLAGHYFDNATFNCTECPKNSYQPFDLMTDCFPCPSNGETHTTATNDARFCHARESEAMQFIRQNTAFLVFIVVVVFIAFSLFFLKNKIVKADRLDPIKPDEKRLLIKTSPDQFALVDVTIRREQHIRPKKKIIEVDREEFLLKASEKRNKVTKQFTNFAFTL